MKKNVRIIAVFTIILLLSAEISPAIARPIEATFDLQLDKKSSYVTPEAISALNILVQIRETNQHETADIDELIASTPPANRTDTDGDGLYDSVEAVLGTDFNNTDSDFDQLNDYYEAKNGLDPLEPDSNKDGIPDYFEVTGVPLDLDGDGFPNAWDFDNDGDGVSDGLDLSPFSRSTLDDNFHFNIKIVIICHF